MKKTISIYIEENIYRRALDKGINVSKFIETKLLELLNILDNSSLMDKALGERVGRDLII
jgi:post-segregation antitoxin (ccd killing protein)